MPASTVNTFYNLRRAYWMGFLALLAAPAASAAELPFSALSGLVSLDQCSGAIFNPGLPETEKALVLTAGHCVAREARLPLKGAVRGVLYGRSGIRVHTESGAIYITGAMIRFATMEGADIALLELPHTYAQLKSKGARVFSQSRVANGKIEMRSAHWSDTFACEAADLPKGVREGRYRIQPSLSLPASCGKVVAGHSGSPIFAADGAITGLVFTTSSGEGAACAEGNPCEEGGGYRPGSIYAQPLAPLAGCLASRFEAPACRKRWRDALWREAPPAFVVESVLIPERALVRHKEFLADLSRAAKVYADIAKFHGITLAFEADWPNTNVLGTEQVGSKDWSVKISGALARHPAITRDALLLAVCHEFGHQLGGFPFKRDSWEPADRVHSGASEAQSDYFASLVCARRVWMDDPLNASLRALAPAGDVQRCMMAHTERADQDLCLRSLEGARALARFFSSLNQVQASVDARETREPVYSVLDEGEYPTSQCRVDTFVAGALCPKSWDDAKIPSLAHPKGQESPEAEAEAERYSCFAREGLAAGARPRCWYVPVRR